MPKTDHLYAKLLKLYQQELPAIGADIATGHSSNHKEHLGRLHTVLTEIVRYIVVDGADKHGLDTTRLVAGTRANDQVAATMAPQHFPASAPVALGAPPLTRQTINTIVGSTPPQNIVAGQPPAEQPDPEPTDVVQIITRLNGFRVVIPPRTSRAPKREFSPGQTADTSYITAIDAADDPTVGTNEV